MNKKLEREMKKIEDTQDELRVSIEHTKELAAEVDKLLTQHKQTLLDQSET